MGKVQQWLTLSDVVRATIRSPQHIRRLIRAGTLKTKRGDDGRTLLISRDSLDDYLKSVEQKMDDRRERLLASLEGRHERPTTRSVKRIRSKVLRDATLTTELRQAFLEALDRYQAEWDARYRDKHPEIIIRS